jgi:hypothetical protein
VNNKIYKNEKKGGRKFKIFVKSNDNLIDLIIRGHYSIKVFEMEKINFEINT